MSVVYTETTAVLRKRHYELMFFPVSTMHFPTVPVSLRQVHKTKTENKVNKAGLAWVTARLRLLSEKIRLAYLCATT